MFDYRTVLFDQDVSEQAWSEHYEPLFVEQLINRTPTFGNMLTLYASLAIERKGWLIDSILEAHLEYSSQFIEKTFDDSVSRAQIIYSYKDEYDFTADFLEKVTQILISDQSSEISRSLISGRITKNQV